VFTAEVGMTWKEFTENTPFEYMPKEDWRQYYIYKQTNPETGLPAGFNTPSGKLEVYLESLITLGRTGQPFSAYPLSPASKDYDPLPYYLEPSESPTDKDGIAEEYPLVMTNGRIPTFHHTTLRNIPWLRELSPAPELWINPLSASAFGISDRDWVWVESKRGRTQAVANVTEGITPGVVCMERFWNPETLNTETHGWREMNVNLLTKATAPFNDVLGTYTLRGFQVKVTKADGPPAGVWLKPSQFKPWLGEACERTEVVN
ncbi:MAG: molybdopterin oxidoreductase, partial [Clostridiales bacterium]|nr:molybdopterin oxidoreductase [Clostridiales bacterium]